MSTIRFDYIDDDKSMQRLLSAIKNTHEVALDIEADSLHHFYEKVCLLQLTINNENYIIDPLSQVDMTEFLETLKDKTIILHDAGYDLRMMQSSFGFELQGKLFDTMLAAQLLGFDHLGLAAMLEEFFGVTISKVGQRWDWSARPLEKEKLEYAACDTHYLHELSGILKGKLIELGRLSWHEESCQKCVDTAIKEKPQADPDREWRIKGSRQLGNRTLTILKNIWYWRQEQAKLADLPPYKIMNNSLMIAIAGFSADKANKPLEKGPRLPKHCIGQRLRKLKKTIEEAKQVPKAEWIQHPRPQFGKRPSATSQHVAEFIKEKCAEIGEELKLAPQIIAPKAAINLIANNRPTTIEEITECSGLMKWQATLLADVIKVALEKYQPKR